DVAQSSGKTVDYLAGLNQAIMGVAFLVGPAVAGVLLASLDSSLVLIITSACSFIAALLTAVLRLAQRKLTEEEQQAAAADNALSLRALKGWGQVVRPAPIRMLAILTFVGVALVGPFLGVLMPAHFQNVEQPFLLGLAFYFYAIGMMISGAGTAKGGADRRRVGGVVAIGRPAVATADGVDYGRDPRAHARTRFFALHRNYAIWRTDWLGHCFWAVNHVIHLSAGSCARRRISSGGCVGDGSWPPGSSELCCF